MLPAPSSFPPSLELLQTDPQKEAPVPSDHRTAGQSAGSEQPAGAARPQQSPMVREVGRREMQGERVRPRPGLGGPQCARVLLRLPRPCELLQDPPEKSLCSSKFFEPNETAVSINQKRSNLAANHTGNFNRFYLTGHVGFMPLGTSSLW